ncbi:hypothetical protein LO762_16520 [Actinocorallia sp. API 0066]|uniref:hypothetical protein n=1 Tax=Actinocorallia sp. API 0066 TaxID=2896846 RepID=UPI001E31B3F6|nr:hypothetical protein [Actinocorallia sp. API 0066]MCD0450783.1 hypothetical protein [Actinocorallia sp. API 0066]
MTLLDRTAANLRLVSDYWPAIAELRDPAVHAPRPSSVIDLRQRAELDYRARQERADRNADAPGAHRDAARAEVLDLMAQLVAGADEMCDEIAAALGIMPPAPPTTAFADPAPQLDFAARHLHQLDHAALRHVAGAADRMASEVTRALFLDPSGQTLRVVCPWCRGGLTGAFSLRVRLLPGHLAAIVCESDIPCEPPARKVGTWWGGRPAWPFEQWRWLARELYRADGRERMTA